MWVVSTVAYCGFHVYYSDPDDRRVFVCPVSTFGFSNSHSCFTGLSLLLGHRNSVIQYILLMLAFR